MKTLRNNRSLRTRGVIALFVALFSVFPFTTIFDFGTYTQPYAVLLGAAFVPFAFKVPLGLPTNACLLWLAFYGVVLFGLAAVDDGVMTVVKYLIAHITPLLVVPPAYYLARFHKAQMVKLLTYGLWAWLAVAVIQAFLEPSFMTFLVGSWSSAGEVVVQSGRGVISLAPEPTTFGFHLIILAASYYILTKRYYISLGIASAAVLLAGSSSSLLVLLMAFFAFIFDYIRLRILLVLSFLVMPILLFLGSLIMTYVGLSDLMAIRVIDLLLLAVESPEILLLDASVNSRLGGLAVAVVECSQRLLFPFGLSMSDWLVERQLLIEEYSFLRHLSGAGFPSGYFIQLYQGGIFFMPIFAYLLVHAARVVRFKCGHRWIVLSAILVPIFQFSFAVPTFWLFWGIYLAAVQRFECKKGG